MSFRKVVNGEKLKDGLISISNRRGEPIIDIAIHNDSVFVEIESGLLQVSGGLNPDPQYGEITRLLFKSGARITLREDQIATYHSSLMAAAR